LGTSEGVLRHAVSRGDLTPAGTKGNRQRLIKEQLMLFSGRNPRTGGKKRISYGALSQQEQALWDRYAQEVERTPATPALETLISQKVQEELARAELARLAQQEQEIARKKEGFRKAYPFLLVPA